MLKFRKVFCIFLISVLLTSILIQVNTPMKVKAAGRPLFVDVNAINNRVANNTWAAAIKADLFAKADLWLNRTPYFYTDSTQYGYRGDFMCTTHNASLRYEYASTTPTQILCPGEDYDYNTTEDNHYVDSSDPNWSIIQKAWNAMWISDHLDAAQTLGLAYLLADAADRKKNQYAQKAADILTDFASKYPNYVLHDRYGNTGVNAGISRGKATSQWLDEAQLIVIPAVWAYDFIYDSGVLSSSDKTSIESMLLDAVINVVKEGTILSGKDYKGTNNWFSWAYAAEASVGYFLNNTSLIDWAKMGFNYQLNYCVRSDGFWWEGTFGYHNMVLNAWFYLCESAYRRGGSTHENLCNSNANLAKMYRAICNAAFPDNLNIQKNNDGGSSTNLYTKSVALNLEVANAVLGDNRFDRYLNQILTVVQREDYMDGATNFSNGPFFNAVPLLIGEPMSDTGAVSYARSADYPGLGSLRTISGSSSGDLYVSMDHGESGGSHAHFDKLNIMLSGKGQVVGEDLGNCMYGLPLSSEYYKYTIAHNTVGVNQQIQAGATGTTNVIQAANRMRVIGASATAAYSNLVTDYRRALIMVDPYIVDVFKVQGATAGTEYSYDWNFHNPDSTLSVTGLSLDYKSGTLGTANGYQHVDTIYTGTTSGQWNALFTNSTDSNKKHSITFLPMSNVTVYKSMSPGRGTTPEIRIPKLVARTNVNGTEAVKYIAVHEIIDGSSQISSINVEDNALKITKTSGDIEYIRHDIENSKYALVAKSSGGTLKNIESVGQNSVNINGIQYLSTTTVPNYMSAKVSGATLNIDQEPYDLGAVNIDIGALNISRVMVNGYSTAFTKNGNILSYTSYSPTKSWEFTSDVNGWTANNGIKGFVWQSGGHARGDIISGDPYIKSPDPLNVGIMYNKMVKIRMRNDTSSTTANIYFVTNADTAWDEAKNKSFAINAYDPGYTDYNINMADIPGWTGTLKQLRIDPNNGVEVGGSFSVDHVWVVGMTAGKYWEFTSDINNWTANSNINNFAWQEGGFMGGTAITGDPYIKSPDYLELGITGRKTIKIRMKNSTSSNSGRVYFITNSDGTWNIEKSKQFTTNINDSNYTEYTIDMSDVSGWTGTLRQLRIDPLNDTCGPFSIDYVWINE